MNIEWIRQYCLSLPHTSEHVVWDEHLVFKVGGKMYAITSLEPAPRWLTLKCTEEEFAELVERPGVEPSPYLARAHWVAIESEFTLPPGDVKRLLRQSYDLVLGKLPEKIRSTLSETAPRGKAAPKKPVQRKRGVRNG